IDQFGTDEADRFAPQMEIDELKSIADASSREELDEVSEPTPSFSKTPAEGQHMSDPKDTARIAELEKANADERAKAEAAEKRLAEFNAAEQANKAKAIVDSAVADGRLLPAQTTGLAEFIAAEAESEFEFAAEDGADPTTVSRATFMAE